MTRPFSEDLRERAVALAEAGQTIRAIGAMLQISPSCVSKWRKLKRDTGGLKHGKIGGHKPRVLTGKWAAWLRRRVLSGRRCTLRGLAAELAARGVKTESRAIWVFLHAEGLSFKKNGARSRTKPPRHRA
jgi:putative transposase